MKWSITRLREAATGRKWGLLLQKVVIYSQKHLRITCLNASLSSPFNVFLFSPLLSYKFMGTWKHIFVNRRTDLSHWVADEQKMDLIAECGWNGWIEWYYRNLNSSKLHLLHTIELMSHLAWYNLGQKSPEFPTLYPHTLKRSDKQKPAHDAS